MEEIVQKVKEIIEPVFRQGHYHLVEIELRGTGNNRVLSIYVDTDQGITLKEVTELTREINDLLDIHDLIPGKYRLEVSSPGLTRPLKHLWQFRKNIGRELKIRFTEQPNTQAKLRGELVSVSENEIQVKSGENVISIPYASIVEAKIVIKF